MGAYAAPCMEENNEKMAALLVSIAYSGSRVDPAIIVSSKCTSVKPSQKFATSVLPCHRLANALYALLRAVFSCSARAAALRITCLVRPAQGHDRKKVSASSAAALLQQARPHTVNGNVRLVRWEPPPHGRRVSRAATSPPAPWSARPSGCDKPARPWSARPSGCNKPARPIVGASLGTQ